MGTFSVLLLIFLTTACPAQASHLRPPIPCPPLTCTSAYRAHEGHTLCLPDHDDVTEKGIPGMMEREVILDLHNEIRRQVDPVATDLYELAWDEDLATVAQKWAEQCKDTRDSDRRILGNGLTIGQNVAVNRGCWRSAIRSWQKQRAEFVYGQGPKRARSIIEDYVQIVSNETYFVGCAYARCNNRNYHVCNYAERREPSNDKYPYTRGEESCSACVICNSSLCWPVRDECLVPNCNSRYSGSHSVCRRDDPTITKSGVSEEEQKLIVDMHNEYRRNVQPTAKQLSVVYWDLKLAAVAEEWAKVCSPDTVESRHREIPSYGIPIGQNVGSGYNSWTDALTAWHNEGKNFQYGVGAVPQGNEAIDKYSQIVQEDTHRVGCGFAECTDMDNVSVGYYVCNYARGQSSRNFPYTNGITCEGCPEKCNEGLCDCNGKVCLNSGTLDLATCKCQCPRLFYGPSCEDSLCGGLECVNGGVLDVNTCTCQCPDYAGGEDCGIICGGLQCANGGTLQLSTCTCACVNSTYTGRRCDSVCGGQRCYNGGTLDLVTCKCDCLDRFTGSQGDCVWALPREVPTCTSEYSENHTLCLDDDPRVTKTGVSEADQKLILDMHNEYRRNVRPTARGLSVMHWDSRVAFVAEKWAKQCTDERDSFSNRRILSLGYYISQNRLTTFSNASWKAVIEEWYSDINRFRYGHEGDGIIRYTRMVNELAHRVGCGFAECSGVGVFICNYIEVLYTPHIIMPYTAGPTCSACQNNCNNGLCDCGGKMCFNEGELDINTCECSCNSQYRIRGPTCEHWYCHPDEPAFTCGILIQQWECEEIYRVPFLCPVLCGRCAP